jgi:hypothetical protein
MISTIIEFILPLEPCPSSVIAKQPIKPVKESAPFSNQ